MDTPSDFISNFGTSLLSGVVNPALDGAKQLVPVWTGQLLGVQKTDQLAAPTYRPDPTKPNLNANVTTGTAASTPATVPAAGGFLANLNPRYLYGGMIVAGLIVGYIVLRK
jgi:hypothetical protein